MSADLIDRGLDPTTVEICARVVEAFRGPLVGGGDGNTRILHPLNPDQVAATVRALLNGDVLREAVTALEAPADMRERAAKVADSYDLDMSGSALDDSDIESMADGANTASQYIAAAIRALPLPAAPAPRPSGFPNNWRTIETAPKDGTEINAYRSDQGVFTCRWATMEELVAHNEAGDPIEDYDEETEGWWHDRWGWLEIDLMPTHWQPLPSPPLSEGE